MEAGRFHLVVSIFREACQLSEPQRSNLLDQRCGDDHALREEVEALLREDDQSMGPIREAGGGQKVLAAQMAQAPGVTGPHDLMRPHVPVLAGQYHIIRVIGEGGMGTVYEAEQAIPRRIVALKAIRRGLASREILRRFEHEAHILGRLHHPGIAQVYEAGASDADHIDQAFIAMEYVRGRPLGEFAAEHGLDVRGRLDLMIKVCDAIQHAHQRGVIHRDLKPANILVETSGQPKILDFGVARAIGGEHPLTTMHTYSGQLLGTLPYMSPEQVSGDPDEIDTRSDVYSLGVILFELLAGRLPHELRNRPLPEAARIIRDVPAPMLGTLKPELRGEIETIVAKAMSKDVDRRYGSAAGLGEDLRRYLRGEPVDARRDSALYVLRKNLSRYRGSVAVALTLVGLLAAFGVVSFVQARENKLLAEERGQQRDRADAEAAKLRRTLYLSRIGFAHSAMLANNDMRFRRLLRECPAELRGWEWHFLNRLADRSIATYAEAAVPARSVAFSGDGRRMAVSHSDGSFSFYDTADRTLIFRRPPGNSPGACVAINRDGSRAWCCNEDGAIAIIQLPGGREIGRFQHDPNIGAPHIAFNATNLLLSADEATLLTGSVDGCIRAYAALSGRHLWRIEGHEIGINHMILLDANRLATAGSDHLVRIWDLDTRAEMRALRTTRLPVSCLAVSPDSTVLASAGQNELVHVWDVAGGLETARLTGHIGAISALCFSGDGRTLLSAGRDRHIRVWDVATGALLRVVRGHSEPVIAVRVLPDRPEFVTCDLSGVIKWWAFPPQPETAVIQTGQENTMCMAIGHDGRAIYSGGTDQVIRRWNADTLELEAEFHGHTSSVYSLDASSDGKWLASASLDKRVMLWRIADQVPVHNVEGEKMAYAVRFSPDGSTLAVGVSDGYVRVFDVEPFRERFSVMAHYRATRAVAFSPDGRRLYSGGIAGDMRCFDAVSGAELHTARLHADMILSLAISPDEQLLATTSSDGTVYISSAAAGERLTECVGHLGPVRCATFNASGDRLVTSGVDGTIRIWETATGDEFLSLTGHERPISVVRFSPDENRLYSCGDDGSVRIWETRN